MRLLGNTAMVLGLAGAMAIGSMTASEARGGRNAALAAWLRRRGRDRRCGGECQRGLLFTVPMAMTATLTHPGYSSGYDSYAYEPAYAAPVYTPPSYYGPVTTYQSTYPGYDTNYIGPWRERQLQGRD